MQLETPFFFLHLPQLVPGLEHFSLSDIADIYICPLSVEEERS